MQVADTVRRNVENGVYANEPESSSSDSSSSSSSESESSSDNAQSPSVAAKNASAENSQGTRIGLFTSFITDGSMICSFFVCCYN